MASKVPAGRRTLRRAAGAARSTSRRVQAGPALHRDAYPVGRVATEFFLRCLELILALDDDVTGSLIIMTLLRDAIADPDKVEPVGVRELSRRLALPFETVRRHARRLVRNGVCVGGKDGIGLAPATRRAQRTSTLLRKLHLHAERLLGDLTRMKVVNFKRRRSSSPASRHLDREQTIIAGASLGVLLAAVKVLRRAFDGDFMCGLVFTAIRAANVKHVTNTAPAAKRAILPDSDRLPVSMLAISDSMRMPYETVRRHAGKLLRQGTCVRVGRRGLIAPASAFQKMTGEARQVLDLVLDFLAELRLAGVKL